MITKRFAYIYNESATEPTNVDIVEYKGNRVVAKVVLQTGNQANRNGRTYRTTDLAGQIIAPRQKELLSTGNMLGEAGHPMTTDLVRQQTIDPKCVCVRYLNFWMDGDNVMGTCKGTNNELGKAFDADLREGILPAFSYRALGTVEETAQGSIVTNLKMITYDYVIYPSHPTAYTVGLVNESATFSNTVSNVAKLIRDEKERAKLDGTKSFVHTFTNESVIEAMKKVQKESAIDYIIDKSSHFNLLKECFDITKSSNIDLLPSGQIAITETSSGIILMDVEDYITKEIQTYTRR